MTANLRAAIRPLVREALILAAKDAFLIILGFTLAAVLLVAIAT